MIPSMSFYLFFLSLSASALLCALASAKRAHQKFFNDLIVTNDLARKSHDNFWRLWTWSWPSFTEAAHFRVSCCYVHDHLVFREKGIRSLVAEDNLVWMGF
jgi:hypothetical protein